ncbi:MAG: mechanosensitive ion channel family protein [Flavobacteriales bacterium]|nr:MAG: mechanosensitive ion channel family protein [Flavobacteriales bacterium]
MKDLLDTLGINLLLLLKVALIVGGAFVAERIIRKLLRRTYLRSEQGYEDRTRYRFLRNAIRFIVGTLAFTAIVYSIPSFKQLAITLFAGAGILVAILGLATQRAFSNIISGIFIVSFKPFRVGDVIKVGAIDSGVVEDITLRHTVIVTFENRRVIIPNAVISDDVIVNSSITEEETCEFVEVRVSYESDLDRAMALLQEECSAHPDCIDKRTPEEVKRNLPKVLVRVIRLDESAVVLRAYAWAKEPVGARMMHYDLNRSIKLRFDREGITIPYPQRTVHVKDLIARNQA